MVADGLVPLLLVLAMCLAPLLILGGRFVRAFSLGSAYENLERARSAPEWVPTEVEVSAARLRRARADRRRTELHAWDSQFHAVEASAYIREARDVLERP